MRLKRIPAFLAIFVLLGFSNGALAQGTAGPSPREVSLQCLKEAHELNERGSQYYNDKQWKLAAEAFKAALDKCPDDPVIQSNYELAKTRLEGATATDKGPGEEQIPERATKPKAKAAPRPKQPKGGPLPPPELPAGGALYGK